MASSVQRKTHGNTALEMSFDNTNDLHDSEVTVQTRGSAVSEDDTSGGWLGAIGSDFRNIASCFKDNIPHVIGGVASLVQQSAMSVAAEIAQLELDGELEAAQRKAEPKNSLKDEDATPLNLPWEIKQQPNLVKSPNYEADEELMERILGLSLRENTFLQPFETTSSFPQPKESSGFELNEQRIILIQRLLEIDDNLAVMHARLSGEQIILRNYGIFRFF